VSWRAPLAVVGNKSLNYRHLPLMLSNIPPMLGNIPLELFNIPPI